MRLLLFLFIFALPTPLLAGAWVVDAGKGKLNFSHFTYRHDLQILQPARKTTVRDDFNALLIEYGLSDTLTLTGKASEARFRAASSRNEIQERRFGIMLDAPYLATGLLPPFVFRLARATLPAMRLTRETRSSLHIGHLSRGTNGGRPKSGRFAVMASADKISSGMWHMMQEIELGETQRGSTVEHDGMYRFSIGRGAWQISSQANRFENEKTGFVALSHTYRLRWKPPEGAFELAIGRGHRRIGQISFPDARIFRGRQWSLEVQRKF